MQQECSACLQTEWLNHLVRVDDEIGKLLDIDDEEEPANGDTTGKDFVKSIYQFIITSSSSHRVARIYNIYFEESYNLPVLYDTANTPNLVVVNYGTFVAPAIYYCVDNGSATQCHPTGDPAQWVLRRSDRNSGGRQVIAENVVDLQVAYRGKNGTWYGTAGCTDRGDCAPATFSSADIDLIRFTLVTRSSQQDKALSNNHSYCRPAVENRSGAAVGSSECGYTYRTYSIQVRPRNT